MRYGESVVLRTLDELGVQYAEVYGSDWLQGWCPMHDDSSPSFTVHKMEGGWKCRAGCGSDGDLAVLVTLLTGEVTADVRRRLDRGFVSDFTSVQRLVEPPQPRVTVTTDEVTSRYPYEHGVAPKYFFDRGFTPETARAWDIGWDPNMRAVVIPVWHGGELRGLVRRPIYWQPGDGAKYKNTPGLRDALLGIDMIPPSVTEVTVVEGPLDAIWLQQLGYPAVATLGSSVSEAQADTLIRRFWRIVLAYDPDKAGRYGALRARAALSRVQIRTLRLPDGRKDVQECSAEELAEAYGRLALLGAVREVANTA